MGDPLEQFTEFPLRFELQTGTINAGDPLICEVVEPLWDPEDGAQDPEQAWLLRDIQARLWGWVAPQGATSAGDIVAVRRTAVLPVVVLREVLEN